jgi:hypothetical protein
VRLTVTALAIASIVVSAFVPMRAERWAHAEDGHLDERDRAILTAAAGGQAGAILVTIAGWMIGLTETFHEAGAVPVVHLYLMFWTSVVVSSLAWLAGIVLAYRRS